jgi:hypothetical protein
MTTRMTIYSDFCIGAAINPNNCSTIISANLPAIESGYQLAVESFVALEDHACVVTAHGIFSQDSYDNRTAGEGITLLVCDTNAYYQPISKNTIGFRLNNNIKNQLFSIQVRNLAGAFHASITKWVLTLVIFPLIE